MAIWQSFPSDIQDARMNWRIAFPRFQKKEIIQYTPTPIPSVSIVQSMTATKSLKMGFQFETDVQVQHNIDIH